MFEFFRDVAIDLMGGDSEEEARKRKEKKEQEKANRIFLSRSTKRVAYVFGILYLLMGGISLFASTLLTGTMQIVPTVKFAILSLLDISAMVCLSMRTKKTEIAAIILAVAFMAAMYVTTLITPLL